MDEVWNRLGTVIAAIITSLGGFYMYDRKVTNDRLTKVETDLAQNKLDIKIIETKFIELKEDTEEIKESQKAIISLLTSKSRRK